MSVTLLDSAKPGAEHRTSRNQTQPDRSAQAEALSLALDASRRQLREVLRQNNELFKVRSLLTEKVSSLELALTKANQLAHYDELTGLPNRRLLLDRFNQASSLANRHKRSVALLFLDLNNFKSVNDQLGHEAGDKLLQQVAIRLVNTIREADTACRYGGDEFVVLLSEVNHRDDALRVLNKIRAAISVPYVINQHCIRLAVSNGTAIYPQDARRLGDLMRMSDHSMLKNKSGSEGESSGVTRLNRLLHRPGQHWRTD